MNHDHIYMARALELAQHGKFTTTPNPNVGCVLVKNQQIVGEGFHRKAGEPHAEINALHSAAEAASGSTAYVTLEPCSHHGSTPPCVDALIAAGVKRVVVAMQDPNPLVAGRGIYRLQQAGIEVQTGVLADEAEKLNRGFLKRMRTGLPYLRLKLAASLDGKTAMASGESKWITSAASRRDVQGFRAESSAILSTSSTVLADDPALTVRWQELAPELQQNYPQQTVRQPVRVVLDSKNRLLSSQYQLFNQPGQTWLVREKTAAQTWSAEKVEELLLPATEQGIDLLTLLLLLGKRGINSIWTEAGATLAGALLQAGLVDELILYLAPKLLGDDARGLCHLPGLTVLAQAPEFSIEEICSVGPDVRLRLLPIHQ